MSKGAVLVTGANGFVGGAVLRRLLADGRRVVGAARTVGSVAGGASLVSAPALSGSADWSDALAGCETVVHAAGRAHVRKECAGEALAEYRRVNVAGTVQLARQAARLGVRRFVFLSSIGVNGNSNTRPFTEEDAPAPESDYAKSKLEAEEALRHLSRETRMEVTVIRPPLVYGPDAPGNFGSLMRAVARGVPLPFGAIDNRRTLVALDNLADLIAICLDHPAASNELFLAGDAEAVSTPDLVRRLAAALGVPARLVSVPPWILAAVAGIAGRRDAMNRMCSSLLVDISKSRQELGWFPPLGLDEGLKRAASLPVSSSRRIAGG